MPQISRSPKRKRVRRYFSASAATGARWNPKVLASSGPSTSSRSRKRGSSISSDETFDFSPSNDHDNEEFHPEEDYRFSDLSNPFLQPRHGDHLESATAQRAPLTYASLPPTPIFPSPPLQPALSAPLPSFPSLDAVYQPPFSIWDYLREELLATDFDSHQELKWERVSNFLNMPIALEKVTSTRLL